MRPELLDPQLCLRPLREGGAVLSPWPWRSAATELVQRQRLALEFTAGRTGWFS